MTHDDYMRRMSREIRWLDRHDHWWLRDVRARQKAAQEKAK